MPLSPVISKESPRALIVGASGQLGTALSQQLGPTALPSARRELDPTWLHIDLAEITATPSLLDTIFSTHNITTVYCAAGATDVERCESDHAWAAAANHLGPLALARAAKNIPFAFFSTDYVFDGTAGPYSEDDAPNALSVYGQTKLDGERSILDAHPRALVLRTTTVYGPDPQGKNFLYTLSRVIKAGNTMRVPTDQLATPVYNADLAAASIALVEGGHTGIFHLAGPDFLSRYDFSLLACGILDLPTAQVQPLTTPELNQKADRPLLGGLRIDKLRATLPHITMRSPAQGIADWKQATA
ncbi:MAG: SDR family oxidoreductase [Bryocella sp.]